MPYRTAEVPYPTATITRLVITARRLRVHPCQAVLAASAHLARVDGRIPHPKEKIPNPKERMEGELAAEATTEAAS